ncbi:hypothetical protein QBC46DRAFT_392073 [Diplogelasinospora grovesii]|uniref:magnesium chelatase n=1 Tax=Diplogelasinospora grovesii TaxID=303347 RepID=A0AAN6S1F5_9PEZI|nr:hypothetical protein QBC46DRAFT_392073 [Diplogelasinospora grovesii]
MAADEDQLLRKIHSLSDLELAALLCLIAREHCLISTTIDSVDELTEELGLVASRTFGLASVVISCHAHTTLDDFASALLLPQHSSSSPVRSDARSVSPYRSRHDPPTSGSYFSSRPVGGPSSLSPTTSTAQQTQQSAQIGNVVLAKNLDRAPRAVQIQALELLRTRRMFTRTSVQAAPKQFLFIAIVGAESGGQAHVTPHLNDFFYIAHWHDPEDGFANLDELDNDLEDDGASTHSSRSVVKRSSTGTSLSPLIGSSTSGTFADDGSYLYPTKESATTPGPIFTEQDISRLAQAGQEVRVDVDVSRYMMNIVSFLRMHRAVGGGVTPTATKHLEQLAKNLAPLHGLDFVTPSLIGLAVRKVYLHRIKIVAPEKERSVQWGSEVQAIETILEGIGPEEVIDDVLSMVAAPQ